MPNSIEINFKEVDYTKTIQASTEVVALINANVPEVKDDDRKGGQKMGDGSGWTFVQKAYDTITADRTLVHVDLLDYDAYKRNVAAMTKLMELKTILGGWIGNMDGAFVVIGKDLMAQSNVVLRALEPLSKSKKLYKTLYDDLNFLYSTRAAKAAVTFEQNNRIVELEKQVTEYKEAAKK